MHEIYTTSAGSTPVSSTDLLSRINADLQSRFGRNAPRQKGKTLDPAVYVSLASSKLRDLRSQGQERYFSLLDFLHRLRSKLNAIATAIKANLSERAFLSALIDLLALNPARCERGLYEVQFSAKDTEAYLGLSVSTYTNVRRSLSQRGIIRLEGDRIDLQPLVEATCDEEEGGEPVAAKTPRQSLPAEAKKNEQLPKSGTSSPLHCKENKVIETSTFKDGRDLFSSNAIKDLIAISPALNRLVCAELEVQDLHSSKIEDIIEALPIAGHQALSERQSGTFNYVIAWKKGWKSHGIETLAALVAALETESIKEPGRWFFQMIKRDSIDVTANIDGIVAKRKIAIEQEQRQALAKRELTSKAAARERREQVARALLASLERLRSSRSLDAKNSAEISDFLWMTLPDRAYVDVNCDKIRICLRRSANKDDDRLMMSVVKSACNDLQFENVSYHFGTIAGIPSISDFK